MSGIASLNEEANRNKILAGLKGGPFFANIGSYSPMTFMDPRTPQDNSKYTPVAVAPKMTVNDVWKSR